MPSSSSDPFAPGSAPGSAADAHRAAPRWNHLYRLWDAALALDPLPPFDKWLARELKKETRFGRRDRLWYSERMFSALRHGLTALFLQSESGSGTPSQPAAPDLVSRVESFGALYRDWSSIREGFRALGPRVLFQWVGLRSALTSDRTADASVFDPSDPPTDEQRLHVERLREAVASPEAPFAIRCLWHGIPLKFAESLQRRVALSRWNAARTARFLSALDTRPPLWLRLRHESDREPVVEEFKKNNITITKTEGLSLAVDASRSVLGLNSFRLGRFAIRDWASQRAGERLDPRPGDCVWDACAGAGGKTLQIAAAMRNDGLILATDSRGPILDELRERMRAAGFSNFIAAPWRGDTAPDFRSDPYVSLASFSESGVAREGFDRVLVDAPCAGSGTWRRNPDGKFRFGADDIRDFAALQSRLLRHAASAVRPGGILVYITCSWLPEENENVVRGFLAEFSEYVLVEMELVGSPDADADTLFVAVLSRVTASCGSSS